MISISSLEPGLSDNLQILFYTTSKRFSSQITSLGKKQHPKKSVMNMLGVEGLK